MLLCLGPVGVSGVYSPPISPRFGPPQAAVTRPTTTSTTTLLSITIHPTSLLPHLASIPTQGLIGMDPNGPEALLATQLFVHGVGLLPGYIPWVIVRYTMRTPDLRPFGTLLREGGTQHVSAECTRHLGCNFTRRGDEGRLIPRPHFDDLPI